MARRKRSAYDTKIIDALIYTPLMVLGGSKRVRRKAAKKWLAVLRMTGK